MTRLPLALAAMLTIAAGPPETDNVPINRIQVVGTHNSYALPADPRVMQALAPRLAGLAEAMQARLSPEARAQLADEHPGGMSDPAEALGYVQLPIEAQLASGVRSLEFDLHPDPEGGRYADPIAYRGLADPMPIHRDELRRPGMKVLHVADLDFRSQCTTFRICLGMLRRWSDATPDHSPVFVLLEPKLSGLDRVVTGAASVPPFDAAAFEEVDRTIAEVLGRDRLFVPDDLRGPSPTLEAAALAGRWPTVAAARGRFVFLHLVPGMNLDVFRPYLDGRPSLQGRMAFVQGRPGMAHAAFLLYDNALVRSAEIRQAVRRGYMVRTRADIDTADARRNDPARRDAALASGAQIVSTDYLTSPNVHGNDFHLAPFPGGWRCAPAGGAC